MIMGSRTAALLRSVVAIFRVMDRGELSSLLPWSLARIRSMGVFAPVAQFE